MEKIEKRLILSKWFSLSYALIGIAFLCFEIMNPGNFLLGHRGILGAIGLIYLAHAFFGFIYYPLKYKRILRDSCWIQEGLPFTGDISFARGVLATIFTIILAWDLCGSEYWTDYAIFAILNFALLSLTRTRHLFVLESTIIDRELLLNESGLEPKHSLLNYYRPRDSQADDWLLMAVRQYVNDYKKSKDLNKSREDLQSYWDSETEAYIREDTLRLREKLGAKD